MLRRFENLNVKGKMNFGYVVVIILMIVSGIFSMTGLEILNSSLNNFVDGANKADTAIKFAKLDINIAARNIREMALNEDISSYPEYKQKVEDMLQGINEQLTIIKETGLLEPELFEKYKKAITDWGSIGYEIIEHIMEGNREEALAHIWDDCVPALNELVSISKEIDAVTSTLMEQALTRNERVFSLCVFVILAFIVVATIAAKMLSKRIVRAITVPLKEIEIVAKELSNGNLHSNLSYSANDEIGNPAESLRASFGTLSSYVDDISRAMNEFSNGNFDVQPTVEWKGDFIHILDAFMVFERSMAKTVKGIHEVAEQVAGGAEQVSQSSLELAQGASEQASITEELAATIETVSEQVAGNAENAKKISKKVEDIGLDIVNSNKKMQEMVNAMSEIQDASNQISTIIATINDIASQTNLLALNASIEAARAGEAGRGFAVVADQVSLLAARSAEAAKKSAGLIESSVNAVEKGIVIADETAKQLSYVVENSAMITEGINKTAEELGAQTEVFEQINVGVDHINDVVQTNSATSEECAAASEEMTSQAATLEDLIARFKVGNFEE